MKRKYDLQSKEIDLDEVSDQVEIRPDTPIILCTGYNAIITADKAKAQGIKKFVKKPILMKKLAKIIRDVLDETDR